MKNILITFLKDVVAAFATCVVIVIGVLMMVLFIDAAWSNFWVWIPVGLIGIVIFKPLVDYWMTFFNKILKNERDTAQS